MIQYLYIALILIIIAGFSCVAAGLVFLIRGYINKNKRVIVGRGWALSILGSIMIVYFIFFLRWVIQEGDDIVYASLFLLFFFFPLAVMFVVLISVFFLVIGVNSLRDGFKKDNENKRDAISIVLGFLMLTLLILVLVCLVIFGGASFNIFGDSLRRSGHKSTSLPSSESMAVLKYYLISLIYK